MLYTDSTYFSGAERSFGILASSLSSHSFLVRLITTPAIAEEYEVYLPKNVLSGTATQSKLSLRWFLTLLRTLRTDHPDVIVVNMWSPYANTLLLLAARWCSIPVITIYHYYQEREAVRGVFRPLKLWAYTLGQRLAHTVLTVSEAHREVLIRQFGFPEGKVGVLLNGVVMPQPGPQIIDHEPRKLLAVGSLEPAKGYAFLLKVLQTIDAPWELTIVGDGPERASLQTLASKCSNPVRFSGRQKDLDPYYRSHDILLQPSHFENLSMAILESMSYGLTAIANDVGGNRELIVHEKTGWLLPLNDEKAWSNAIVTACTSPLAHLRKEASKRCVTHFTSEIQANTLQAYIENISHA